MGFSRYRLVFGVSFSPLSQTSFQAFACKLPPLMPPGPQIWFALSPTAESAVTSSASRLEPIHLLSLSHSIARRHLVPPGSDDKPSFRLPTTPQDWFDHWPSSSDAPILLDCCLLFPLSLFFGFYQPLSGPVENRLNLRKVFLRTA